MCKCNPSLTPHTCVTRGHNELDNPSLTQPIMYDTIEGRSSVPDAYAQQLEVSQSAYVCMELARLYYCRVKELQVKTPLLACQRNTSVSLVTA